MRFASSPILICFALLAAAQCPAQSPGGSGDVRLWSGDDADFLTGDVSPDARYFSDIDWDTGDLHLIELESGKARELTGRGYDAGRYAWTSAFSRDGSRIAVSWYSYSTDAHELRLHDVGTGSSILLVSAKPELAYLDPLDWSPAEDIILVGLRGVHSAWRLAVVDVDSGAIRVLASLSWPAPGGGQAQSYPRAEFSPDGKLVAYDYPSDPELGPRNVYAVSVEGGQPLLLYRGRASTRFLGWLPGGRGILFYEDRGDGPSIWRLPFDQDEPGEPQLVERNVAGLIPLGFAGGGYVYGKTVAAPKPHVAELDVLRSRVTAPPQPLRSAPSRAALAAAFSPNGQRIAYVSHNPLPSAPESVAIQRVDGSMLEEIPVPRWLHTSSGSIEWPSENSIYLFGRERGDFGAFRLDLRNRTFTRVGPRPRPGDAWKFFDVARDEGKLYLARRLEGAPGLHEIVAHDLEDGKERLVRIARMDQRTLTASPDGRRIAYVGRVAGGAAELRVTDAEGAGEEQILHRAGPGMIVRGPLAWTPDGTHIIFVGHAAAGGRGLWSLPVSEPGVPRFVEASGWCCAGQDVQFHPDGRRVVFIAGDDRSEIRILNAF